MVGITLLILQKEKILSKPLKKAPLRDKKKRVFSKIYLQTLLWANFGDYAVNIFYLKYTRKCRKSHHLFLSAKCALASSSNAKNHKSPFFLVSFFSSGRPISWSRDRYQYLGVGQGKDDPTKRSVIINIKKTTDAIQRFLTQVYFSWQCSDICKISTLHCFVNSCYRLGKLKWRLGEEREREREGEANSRQGPTHKRSFPHIHSPALSTKTNIHRKNRTI